MRGKLMFSDGFGRRLARRAIRVSFAMPLVLLSSGMPASLFGQFSGPALKLPQHVDVPQTPTAPADIPESQPHDLRISPGDVITVHLFGSMDFAPVVKVSVDGTVQLPLIGLIPVAGLKVEEAADAIAHALLKDGMYNDPQVTVQLTEAVNQYATVTGELHAVIPLLGQRRLLDVLALASSGGGGETASAAGNVGFSGGGTTSGFPISASHVVTIIRQGQAKPIVVDLGTDPMRAGDANIVIQPHDLIVLSRIGSVFIVGAFAKQGAIPLDQNSPLTLLEATSLAGGTGFEGRFENLAIIRTEGLERKMVKVDVKRILQGKDPDPVLQANDIVFLPTNLLKAALKGGGIGAVASILDVAILAIDK